MCHRPGALRCQTDTLSLYGSNPWAGRDTLERRGGAYPRALVTEYESGTAVTLTVLGKEPDSRERLAISEVARVRRQEQT